MSYNPFLQLWLHHILDLALKCLKGIVFVEHGDQEFDKPDNKVDKEVDKKLDKTEYKLNKALNKERLL
jgi:hypothetical protein